MHMNPFRKISKRAIAPDALPHKRNTHSTSDSRCEERLGTGGGGGGGADDDEFAPNFGSSQSTATTDERSSAAAPLFDADVNTERSVRERSVARSLGLSATNSQERGRGAMRDELSSVHLESSQAQESAGDGDGEQRPTRRRGRAGGVIIGVPAPPLAPAPGAGAVSTCPICREQFQSVFDDNRSMAESVDARASGVKSTARNAKARSAIRDLVTNRHKMIFQAESIVRGRMHDDHIIDFMLEARQRMIEDHLAAYDIPFVPWTAAALRAHFDPRNEHVFDEVREIKNELRSTRDAITRLERCCFLTDPNNPARMVYDPKAITALHKMAGHKMKLITALGKALRNTDEDVAGAMYAMTSALTQKTNDGAAEMVRDPRTAAGTVAVGGDALRSAGAKQSVGTAQDMYNISGY